MTRSLKYGLLLAAALAAPASAVDSDLTEAIAYHCGWQLGQFGMQSTDITKEELPKCKEIRDGRGHWPRAPRSGANPISVS
jgi:hypothetical protein